MLLLFYGWENWGPKKFSNLPKVTQLLSGKPGSKLKQPGSNICTLNDQVELPVFILPECV